MSYSRNYQLGYDSRTLKVDVLVVMHVLTMQGGTVINEGFAFISNEEQYSFIAFIRVSSLESPNDL
jgi:hypothetical protein